jgi:capsular polysaccharide biosynthesis protein
MNDAPRLAAALWALRGQTALRNGRPQTARRAFRAALHELDEQPMRDISSALRPLIDDAEVIVREWGTVPQNAAIAKLLWAVVHAAGAKEEAWIAACLAKDGPLNGLDTQRLGLAPKGATYDLLPMREWAQRTGASLVDVGQAEPIPWQTPRIFDAKGLTPEGPQHSWNALVPYVAELRDATIFAKSAVVTVGTTAFHDAATHPTLGRFTSLEHDRSILLQGRHHIVLRRDEQKIAPYPGGFYLGGLNADAFGHWVPEYLPKLFFFERHSAFHQWPLIVEESMPPSHFDYLAALTDRPLVRLAPGTGLRCQRLFYAPTPTFHPPEVFNVPDLPFNEICAFSQKALHEMRARVLAKIDGPSPAGKRFYLTRRAMRWRRLLNDADVAAYLESQGFAIIAPETLSFADQVRLFRNAEIIVAPIGSSFENLVFAPQGVKVLVLSQKNLFNSNPYYSMMRGVGADPLFVCGDEADPFKHADFIVPLDRIRAALQQIETER